MRKLGDLGKAVEDILTERKKVARAERKTIRALDRTLRRLGYKVVQARGPGRGRRRRRRGKALPSQPRRRRVGRR